MSVSVNMDTAGPPEDPKLEAERWFARLRADDCTAEDCRAFEHWRGQRLENARAFAVTERTWACMEELTEDDEVAAWRREAQSVSGLHSRRRVYALAASVALAVLVPLAWFSMTRWDASREAFATARGEQRKLTLQDGSLLMLNTDTRLRVQLDGSRRDIVLESGEALFEVARDPQRPFRVITGDGVVTVLGTRFMIAHGGRGTAVTLLDGGVAVEDIASGRVEQLALNEQLTLGAMGWRKQTIDPLVVSSWTAGKLVFRSASLGHVLAEVNRYGPGRIELADESLADLEVSGTFRLGQPQALLRALESAFPITVQAAPGDVTRLQRRPD